MDEDKKQITDTEESINSFDDTKATEDATFTDNANVTEDVIATKDAIAKDDVIVTEDAVPTEDAIAKDDVIATDDAVPTDDAIQTDDAQDIITASKNDNKIKKYLPYILGGIGIILIGIILICVFSKKEETTSGNPAVTLTEAPTAAPSVTPTPSPAPTATPTPTPTPEPTPTPDLHVGEKQSEISGEWLAEETANQRPYCIMFNNIAVANPQSGIGEASIVYEALAEAGITRLMGVFENLSEESACADRIGSVRSARHYFASIADEYDSIFIHYGETSYASRKIEKLKMDHMDGIDGIGSTVYYRDTTIKAPHNAFANLSGILKGIEKCGFRTVKEKDTGNHFVFNEEDTELSENVQTAEKVTLAFSSYTSPYLVYNPETKQYTRYQFGDVHIDCNTGLPLTFKNIIVQIVHEYDKDKNGYQTMDISDNSGSGYYITNGRAVKITWEKKEKTKYMVYKDENGNILSINPGKTFIAVYPDFRTDKLKFE